MSQSSFYSDLNLNVPSKDLDPDCGMFPDSVGRFLCLVEVPCKALEILIISSKMFVEGPDPKQFE